MEDLNLFELLVSIAFGAIFGSYATLFAYRLPLRESCFGRYFGKKSRCPNCEAVIKTRDLVPVLNWLFTLGKCRNCLVKIPRTHLFIELSTTILFVICYLKFSFGQEFIIYSLISVCCVILLVTNFTHKIFPQSLLIFLLILVLVNRVLVEQNIFGIIYSSILGIICSVVFYRIFYKISNNLFATQEQTFDYVKFILIASVGLSKIDFAAFFLIVLLNFVILLMLKMVKTSRKYGFGYIFILPFLLLMLYQISPLNSL